MATKEKELEKREGSRERDGHNNGLMLRQKLPHARKRRVIELCGHHHLAVT